jgi:hypothetical protein
VTTCFLPSSSDTSICVYDAARFPLLRISSVCSTSTCTYDVTSDDLRLTSRTISLTIYAYDAFHDESQRDTSLEREIRSTVAGDDPVNNSDPTGLCVSTWFGCVGPGPANGISGTLGETWNDTGGKVVSVVHQHWRGIVQGVIYVAGAAAIVVCTVATDGVCAALTVELAGTEFSGGALLTSAAIGAVEHAGIYAVSNECHTFSGYLEEAGIGAGLGLTEGVADEISPLGVSAQHATPAGYWQTLAHIWAS